MKIGVISDTHGRQLAIKRVMNAIDDVDLIIHLGDYMRDAIYMEKTTKTPILYVPGNCDYPTTKAPNKLHRIGNYSIFMTHGHLYRVKQGYDRIVKKARELDVDVALFGHTHIPKIFERHDILFVNPGSIGIPGAGRRATYAVLEIGKDKVKGYLKTL